MTITIHPLEKADVARSVRLELEAFRDHPRTPIMWPRGYTDDLYAYSEKKRNESFSDDETRLMKAVDSETGEIVAIAEWTFALDPKIEADKPPTDPNQQPPEDWPADGNWACRQFYKKAWNEWRQEMLAGKPYIILDILTVDPNCQGKGAGSKLLAWGVEQADARGIAMCLESTPAGLNIYGRFGFKEQKIVRADMKAFGWTKPYDEDAAVRIWMIREPQAATTNGEKS